jgi:DNA repair protein RadC
MKMSEFQPITQWNADDRPREKMIRLGPSALSHAELLAILINTGTARHSALDLGRAVLKAGRDNLLELGRLSLSDLSAIHGIGQKKAVTLMAALELGRRRQGAEGPERPQISSSRDIFRLLNPFFLDKSAEEFVVVYLNQAHRVLHTEALSKGGLTATVVDPRLIFRRALEVKGTCRIALAHNHPSGQLQPSEADRQLTQRVRDSGLLLDIRLLDHLILAENRYYSFADEGLL